MQHVHTMVELCIELCALHTWFHIPGLCGYLASAIELNFANHLHAWGLTTTSVEYS